MSVGVQSQIRPSHTIGRTSQSGPGFNAPNDVAVAPDGRLYVLSRSNLPQAPRNYLRVSIVTMDEEYIGQFTEYGTDDGQIVWPTAVVVSPDYTVYVSDESRHDVQIFDKDGNFQGKFGAQGSGPGEFDRPAGLAIDKDGNVLVTDCLNNRVQRLSPDGKYIGEFGKAGTGPGEFNMPWGIAVDKQGFIYVVDWRNSRVQKFDNDGNYLLSFGGTEGEGSLDRPAGVDVDSVGNVYVSDYGRDLLQVYNADGSLLKTLTGDATVSKWGATYIAADPEMTALRAANAEAVKAWESPFASPMGVAVDAEDRIIICDSARNRVQVYQRS
jgi:DNA-binding beta-propeller fold protein YncE